MSKMVEEVVSPSVIDGVRIIPLRQILDERGKIMHMLKATDPHFSKFGEIYFSCAWPGAVKAWHVHKTMILNYAVIVGRVKLVLYDSRKDSPTHEKIMELFIGDDRVGPTGWRAWPGCR